MVMILTLLARKHATCSPRINTNGMLKRIHLRIDSRVTDLEKMAALLGQLREWVSCLNCSLGDDACSLTARE